MTLDIPTRPQEQQAPADDRRQRRGLKGGPQITFGRSPRAGKAPLVVGAQPRASLLPPEIVVKRQQLKTRRGLRVGVFFVFVATVAGCVGVWGLASVSQAQLAAAQVQQQDLVNQQFQYQDVRDVQDTIKLIQAGQMVGGSTEINWRDYLTQVQKSLPTGVTIDGITIASGSPMEAFAQSEAPLQGKRVASLLFTVRTAKLTTIPDWLRKLALLPGFVDATPGTATFTEGKYTVQVEMNISTDAFSLRFDPEHVAEAEAAAAAAAKSDGTVKSLTAKSSADDATDDTTSDTEGSN